MKNYLSEIMMHQVTQVNLCYLVWGTSILQQVIFLKRNLYEEQIMVQ